MRARSHAASMRPVRPSPRTTDRGSSRPAQTRSWSAASRPTIPHSARASGGWSESSDRADWWSWEPGRSHWRRRPTGARLVEAAAADAPGALVNHRYSADVLAIALAQTALRDVPPDLRSDNALPRWLAEVAGVPVRDLRARRRLAMDVDSPLDLLLLEGARGAPDLPLPGDPEADPVRARLARLRALAGDPGAELLVAGRTSAADLQWAERHTRSRTRALVEERGLRTASGGAAVGRPNRRPARGVLGMLLDAEGPAAFGSLVAGLADGALIDSRVLMAHRSGGDERGWPVEEDRFASDLLDPTPIADPWLRELTAAAAAAPIPILLGGHSLVGPGLHLALRRPRGRA